MKLFYSTNYKSLINLKLMQKTKKMYTPIVVTDYKLRKNIRIDKHTSLECLFHILYLKIEMKMLQLTFCMHLNMNPHGCNICSDDSVSEL